MKKNVKETSLEAYQEIQQSIGIRQQEVLGALIRLCANFGDATDYELATCLNKTDPNYVRPRRWELVNELKLVGFSSKRPCRITGRMALAWKPVGVR